MTAYQMEGLSVIEKINNRNELNHETEGVSNIVERTEPFYNHNIERNGQELAEKTHLETKESVLREYGEAMSSAQIQRLEKINTTEHIHVIDSEEYVEKFNDVPFDVVGHCDNKGEIYIKNLSPESVKHISAHETMHLCSFRDVSVRKQDGSEIRRSGLRDFRETPAGEIKSYNVGINEGLTEMYTLRELNRLGETEAANAMKCYAEERIWAERLEMIVGEKFVEKAYFGGERTALVDEFNRLNNDVSAWQKFSKNLDILYNKGDRQSMERASRELTKQYFTMISNKYN